MSTIYLQSTRFNSITSIIYLLDMTESRPAFLALWKNNLGRAFIIKGKKVGRDTPPAENNYIFAIWICAFIHILAPASIFNHSLCEKSWRNEKTTWVSVKRSVSVSVCQTLGLKKWGRGASGSTRLQHLGTRCHLPAINSTLGDNFCLVIFAAILKKPRQRQSRLSNTLV